MTTRAIASRAGVPHGAISYHFAGREDLLREAATTKLAELFDPPLALARTAPGTTALVEETLGWFEAGGLAAPAAGILVEILCQAARDDSLREQAAGMLRQYREALNDLIRASGRPGEQPPAPADGAATGEGLAAIIAAVMDGLLLHAFIDRDLNLSAARTALLDLLATRGH